MVQNDWALGKYATQHRHKRVRHCYQKKGVAESHARTTTRRMEEPYHPAGHAEGENLN